MESKTIHGLSLQSQLIKRGSRYSKSHWKVETISEVQYK